MNGRKIETNGIMLRYPQKVSNNFLGKELRLTSSLPAETNQLIIHQGHRSKAVFRDSLVDCEQPLFFFIFSKGSACARER